MDNVKGSDDINREFSLDDIYEYNYFGYEDFEITNSFDVLDTYFTILEHEIITKRSELIAKERDNINSLSTYFSKDDKVFEIMKVTRYSSLISIFSNFEYILFRICVRYSKECFDIDFEPSRKTKDNLGGLKEHLVKNIIGEKESQIIVKIYQTISTISKLRHIVTHHGGMIIEAKRKEYKSAKGMLENRGIIIETINITHNASILKFKKDLLDFTLIQMRRFFEELLQKLDEKYSKSQGDVQI